MRHVLHTEAFPGFFGVWWCVLSSLKSAKKYTPDNGGMIRNQYQNHNTVFCAKKSDSPQQYTPYKAGFIFAQFLFGFYCWFIFTGLFVFNEFALHCLFTSKFISRIMRKLAQCAKRWEVNSRVCALCLQTASSISTIMSF